MWIALSCPYLAFDALTVTNSDTPYVMVEPYRARVLAANPAAQQLGIHPHTPLALAFTLAPQLELVEENKSMTQNHLETLAQALGDCSASVCIQAPDCVVLEVASMMKYFGSLYDLLHQIERSASQWIAQFNMALAPTALLAQWRAQAGQPFLISAQSVRQGNDIAIEDMSLKYITNWLQNVPIWASRWSEQNLERLTGLGFKTLDELYLLPNSALRLHLGAGLQQQFGKAIGTIKDPLKPYLIPDQFVRTLEFDREVENSLALLFPLNNIIQALSVFLRRHRWKLYELSIQLTPAWHLADTSDTLEIVIRHDLGSDNAKLWLELVELKLSRMCLSAPIRGLSVSAIRWESSSEVSGDLFDQSINRQRDIALFASRIQARLGHDALKVPQVSGEHLPEAFASYQSIEVSALTSSNPSDFTPVADSLPVRPHWLLPEPQSIAEHNFTLLSGPERISTAWWSNQGHLTRRDYFQAHWHDERVAWVFRDDQGNWFLHGWFA